MARKGTSLIRRALVQSDRAFWCIHEHLDSLVLLAMPMVGCVLLAALASVLILRTWEFPNWVNVLLGGIVLPLLSLLIFTVFPLPCAVFAWRLACGESATVRGCFAACAQRSGRLFSVVLRLILLWLFSLALFGLPLLWIWPRTCLTPLVALFEDQPRIFYRSRRILREDLAVYLLGSLYLAMAIVLAGVVYLPRFLLAFGALGAHFVASNWSTVILQYLWIFEVLSTTLLLSALAVSWWISLTLLYHEIRWVREGEDLRRRIFDVREALA